MGLGTKVYGTEAAVTSETSVAVKTIPVMVEQREACGTENSPRPASLESRQVADDIIRRLRRMGINFSKTRLSKPYGLEGDVC
jgi:hypothetical protein